MRILQFCCAYFSIFSSYSFRDQLVILLQTSERKYDFERKLKNHEFRGLRRNTREPRQPYKNVFRTASLSSLYSISRTWSEHIIHIGFVFIIIRGNSSRMNVYHACLGTYNIHIHHSGSILRCTLSNSNRSPVEMCARREIKTNSSNVYYSLGYVRVKYVESI